MSDLAGLTLEQLANIQVTSVSRREERLADAAGSVFVISSEDIRRSGAVNLPEVLRLAPNLHVARADANQYAISARGFNSTTANKMLVLVDGRTVYSPLFSGVFWDAQDVMLEDVERIEVLSGPGGTLWGSNAVNGFINIITKTAQATQGGLVSLGVGTRDRAHALRWGGSLGGDGFYRVYGKHSSRDNTVNPAGASKQDGSGKTQAGFRADWGLGADKVTLQGDAYQSDIDQATPNGDRHLEGANILGRYVRELGPSSGLRLQAYVDHTLRRQPGSVIDRLDTLDVDIQHNFQPTPSQRVLWGAGYRVQDDRVDNISAGLAFLPAQKNLKLANVFAQDEIALAPGLDFTLGLKLEHNDYTGLEYLPNARLAWRPAAGHLVWGGVSRTLRIPSRIDRELFAPATPPYTALAGGANFRSEVADVFEFGYRSQATPALAYSATLFHHRFDRQRSVEPTAAGPVISNMIDGTTSGVEAWGTYRASSSWRLKAGMFWQRQKLQLKAGSASIGGVTNLGNDPGHQWSVGSSWDLAPAVELDVTARHTGALPNPTLASYTALDMRVGWRPRAGMDVSVTLQNLAGARHYEWGSPASRAQIERAAFVKLAWKL
ncbi:MAG: TonB-dependent receptor [Comamonadaceae bacterium]|nr:MAG: TonB-dependent receptor [Comamonadaceae bacterium]